MVKMILQFYYLTRLVVVRRFLASSGQELGIHDLHFLVAMVKSVRVQVSFYVPMIREIGTIYGTFQVLIHFTGLRCVQNSWRTRTRLCLVQRSIDPVCCPPHMPQLSERRIATFHFQTQTFEGKLFLYEIGESSNMGFKF